MCISTVPASARFEHLLATVDPGTGSYPGRQSSPESRSDHPWRSQVNGILGSRGFKHLLSLSELMFVDFE